MNTHFEVFASYNILQYLSDFIHVLIFVTVTKCRKSPKLTNIVIVLVMNQITTRWTCNVKICELGYLKSRQRAANARSWLAYKDAVAWWRAAIWIDPSSKVSTSMATGTVRPIVIPKSAKTGRNTRRAGLTSAPTVAHVWITCKARVPSLVASSSFNLNPAGTPINHMQPVLMMSFVNIRTILCTNWAIEDSYKRTRTPAMAPITTSTAIAVHVECLFCAHRWAMAMLACSDLHSCWKVSWTTGQILHKIE